jgi:hypothetical protein
MMELHYGVIKDGEAWAIVGQGLKAGHYDSPSEALRAARRMADHSSGLPVHLHFPNELGGCQSERWAGEA